MSLSQKGSNWYAAVWQNDKQHLRPETVCDEDAEAVDKHSGFRVVIVIRRTD